MGDSIYVIKPDTFFSNIAQDSIARNNINKELEANTPLELKEPSELYNAIENWDTGDSLAKAEWKQWALSDFEGFKEYYKQYRTLLKNLDIDKLYGAKAKPNRVASYGTKTDIGKELFQSLLKVGFSEVLALAILANSYHETMGWNKMNLLNNGPATGLLQMEEAARLSYDNFREANNLEENTNALALYIASLFLNGKSIPTTYYDNSGKGEAYTTALALEDWNSGDLSKTVKAFMYSYERPGTPMLDRRLGVALLLSDNKHLFYKEGGSIKRNNTKSTFFAKDGLPGGMLFVYLQPSSTSVLSYSSVLPVEYYDKNIVQSAKALGLTVEEYLKLIEKSNLPGVVYEDSGNDGVNYYRSRTATDPRARDAAAVERRRQDQALEQLRQEAGKAANLLFSLGMPSTYVGLATGAMDLSTGEGKDNTAGKIWGNTRLVLDIAVPIAGLSVYKGVRQVPRLYKNLYYKLASPRIGLTRTFNKGLNETVAEILQNAMTPVQINKYGTVKYYGPTMGKTTATKTNPRLVDFDDIVREEIQQLANKKGISVRELKTKSDIEYTLLLENAVSKWQANPANKDKTLLVSNSVLSNKPIFDNTPVIPSKDLFIARQVARGESDPTYAALYYDDLLKRNPLLKIDDRFVSEIESGTRSAKISESELSGIPRGERNLPYKEKIPVSTTFNSPDIPIANISKASELLPLEVSRLRSALNKSNNLLFYQTLDYFQTNDFPIIKELLSKDYITAARNYYANLGINTSSYSDETIAKVLTDSYNLLKNKLSGVLKGKVLWHGSGFKPFDILDASKSGEFTGNQGLYGNGFYLTNYPNSYGLHGYYNNLLNKTKYINNSLPYLVDGVFEIGGNPLVETNSYGLAWHLPEGNLTIPYSPTKTYNRLYFGHDNSFGIPEGYLWVAKNSDGSFRLAPKDFKGYNIRKGKFSEGQFYLKDQGTGYKVALGNNSWLSKNKGRAFLSRLTIDSSSPLTPQLIPSYKQDGIEYPATEIVVPYSSSVKSLIPHPSTASGTSFVRNWKDPRINYIIGAPFIVGTGLTTFNKK